jgi:hypothetical protein
MRESAATWLQYPDRREQNAQKEIFVRIPDDQLQAAVTTGNESLMRAYGSVVAGNGNWANVYEIQMFAIISNRRVCMYNESAAGIQRIFTFAQYEGADRSLEAQTHPQLSLLQETARNSGEGMHFEPLVLNPAGMAIGSVAPTRPAHATYPAAVVAHEIHTPTGAFFDAFALSEHAHACRSSGTPKQTMAFVRAACGGRAAGDVARATASALGVSVGVYERAAGAQYVLKACHAAGRRGVGVALVRSWEGGFARWNALWLGECAA